MKVKTFFIGVMVAFAIPWLLIVVYPSLAYKNREAVAFLNLEGEPQIYLGGMTNHYQRGSEVYRSENCQSCHTQVIRNSFAGSEIFRQDWAGVVETDATGQVIKDTRRESTSWDYRESYASIGERRTGPDLMNYGLCVQIEVEAINAANLTDITAGLARPITAEEVVALHLYDPRNDTLKRLGFKHRSNCVSLKNDLFEKVSGAGQGSAQALPIKDKSGKQIVPNANGRALIKYLIGRKRDDKMPYVLDKSGKASDGAE